MDINNIEEDKEEDKKDDKDGEEAEEGGWGGIIFFAPPFMKYERGPRPTAKLSSLTFRKSHRLSCHCVMGRKNFKNKYYI